MEELVVCSSAKECAFARGQGCRHSKPHKRGFIPHCDLGCNNSSGVKGGKCISVEEKGGVEKVSYKRLKKITGKELVRAQGGCDSPVFDEHFQDYLHEFDSSLYIGEPDFKVVIQWAEEDRARINYLIKHGFIEEEKKWEPCEVTFKLKSPADIVVLYHRLNAGPLWYDHYYKSGCSTDIKTSVEKGEASCNNKGAFFDQIYELAKEKGLLKK